MILTRRIGLLTNPQALCILRSSRCYSAPQEEMGSYKVLIAGGGCGGASMAHRMVHKLGIGKVAVIEPRDTHYYQPMWTLVGGGIKKLSQSARPMAAVLPKKATWIQDTVKQFDPESNKVHLKSGKQISYEYLIIALGLQLKYENIPGLEEALETDPRVCSNYSSKYVLKTFPAIQAVRGGNVLFTHPNTPIKCTGASQKIMYLAEELIRKFGQRNETEIAFCTPNAVIFGVPHYAATLSKILEERNLLLKPRHLLVEVNSKKSTANFQTFREDGTKGDVVSMTYDFLHVTPPMLPPEPIASNELLTAESAPYLHVNGNTLQHQKFQNIFALGDNLNMNAIKTAAAVSAQTRIVRKNLSSMLDGKQLSASYDKYTSCPVVTGLGKAILAEFDNDGKLLETFVWPRQNHPSSFWYHFKVSMSHIYFHALIPGWWEGPATMRKLLHLGGLIKDNK